MGGVTYGGGITYKDTGVDYDAMDPFKRMAQLAGRETASNIARLNNGEFKEVELSRGESAYLIEAMKSYFAHVEEGLGTKNLIADAMYRLTGKSYYDNVAQDTVAMIVNDMITLGALPLSVAMHSRSAIQIGLPTRKDCKISLMVGNMPAIWRAASGVAARTPTLKDVIMPDSIVLAGSAMGIIKPKERLIMADKIRHGDEIVFIESSGIHANGLTLARKIADKLSDGYLTKLSDGRTYGKTLLDPTYIYVGLVEDCLNRGLDIHYAVNITGHGWRKLMRAVQPFAYIIETLPDPLPIFDFIQRNGPVDDREAYGNLNMGAGFALYVSETDVDRVFETASAHQLRAFNAGYIEQSDEKKVVIRPKNIEYLGVTLGVR